MPCFLPPYFFPFLLQYGIVGQIKGHHGPTLAHGPGLSISALKWSKLTVNTFVMLQKIYISNKWCSNFLFITESWKDFKHSNWFQHNIDKKWFLSSKSTYQNDFWRIMWHWKFSFTITGINYILKYIQIENSYLKM